LTLSPRADLVESALLLLFKHLSFFTSDAERKPDDPSAGVGMAAAFAARKDPTSVSSFDAAGIKEDLKDVVDELSSRLDSVRLF
jgi:hypothetical protein